MPLISPLMPVPVIQETDFLILCRLANVKQQLQVFAHDVALKA